MAMLGQQYGRAQCADTFRWFIRVVKAALQCYCDSTQRRFKGCPKFNKLGGYRCAFRTLAVGTAAVLQQQFVAFVSNTQ
jgi:hypothetical protein